MTLSSSICSPWRISWLILLLLELLRIWLFSNSIWVISSSVDLTPSSLTAAGIHLLGKLAASLSKFHLRFFSFFCSYKQSDPAHSICNKSVAFYDFWEVALRWKPHLSHLFQFITSDIIIIMRLILQVFVLENSWLFLLFPFGFSIFLWPSCIDPLSSSSLGYLVASSNSVTYNVASSSLWGSLLSSMRTLAFLFVRPNRNLETRSSCFVKLDRRNSI